MSKRAGRSVLRELAFYCCNQLGSVGRGVGGEARYDFSIAADDEFLEVPLDFGRGIGVDVVLLENGSPSGRIAFGAWLRGCRSGIWGWARMRLKHRELMAKRRITDAEFLAQLRESERQIYEWRQSQSPEERSGLLNFYFRIFGKP